MTRRELVEAIGDMLSKEAQEQGSSPEEPQGGPSPPGEDKPVPLQFQAWNAFCYDLQRLLRDHPGKWIAYRGSEQKCIGESKTMVYQECLRRGLDPKELLVEMIYPAADEIPTMFEPAPAEMGKGA